MKAEVLGNYWFMRNISNERKGIWGFIKGNKQVIFELHGDHDQV